MSFGINGPEPVSGIQRSHHTNDGGAGNLGYFQQEKNQNEDEEQNQDTFESSKKEEKEDDSKNIGNRIKTFWFKIHGIFDEAVSEKEEKK